VGRGLVFCTRTGDPLDAANVRRAFRVITCKAGVGENWTPHKLRHSFVPIVSDSGMPLETIADLIGHAGAAHDREDPSPSAQGPSSPRAPRP